MRVHTEPNLLIRRFDADFRPLIVCLCGSTKFPDEFAKASRKLGLAGVIVLSVSMFGHSGDLTPEQCTDGHPTKTALDGLHKRKIDLADIVLVLNKGHYVGTSTASEIIYAYDHGVEVHYLEDSWTFGRLPVGTNVPGSGVLKARNPHPTPDSTYGHFTFERENGEVWHRGGRFDEKVPVAIGKGGLVTARKTNWHWLPRPAMAASPLPGTGEGT